MKSELDNLAELFAQVAKEISPQLSSWRRHLHAHPELSYKEFKTMEFVCCELDKMGRVDKSNHIPRGMLEFWLDPDGPYFKNGKLDMSKDLVLFCAGGLRSALAVKSLKEMGFENISHIDGGFAAISQSDFKIV